MRLFVRLSLIGLVALVAIGFAFNQMRTDGTTEQQLPVSVSQGQCDSTGISLVVDFGDESPTIEKCIKNYSGNSWDLFSAAGLLVEGTEKYPVGFVCRIQGIPNQEQEACKDTPGALTGSWAFFTAQNDIWEYSASGASTHKAKCGTAEGWRYLKNDEPIQTPPRVSPKVHACQ
jgi:hypothetical protein